MSSHPSPCGVLAHPHWVGATALRYEQHPSDSTIALRRRASRSRVAGSARAPARTRSVAAVDSARAGCWTTPTDRAPTAHSSGTVFHALTLARGRIACDGRHQLAAWTCAHAKEIGNATQTPPFKTITQPRYWGVHFLECALRKEAVKPPPDARGNDGETPGDTPVWRKHWRPRVRHLADRQAPVLHKLA